MTATAEPASGARLPYWPALDGLRGLSVAAILCFHAGFGWAKGGYLGVTVFFTLSGFLLTSLAMAERERTGGIGITAFWARRARRLLPASLLALLLALFVTAVAVPEVQQTTAVGDIRAALLHVANWRFIAQGAAYADLGVVPSPVQHYWSLAIEEQFYLLFPIVAAFALRRRPAVLGGVFAAMVALSLAQQARLDGVDRLYFGTDTRVAELAVGGLLALAYPRLRVLLADLRWRHLADVAGFVGVAVLVGCIPWMTVDRQPVTGGGLTMLGVVSTLAVLGAVEGPVAGRVLGARPLVELGKISYGVYLFHFPLFMLLDPDRVGVGGTRLFAVRVAATLALATVSSRWLEQPIRKGRALHGRAAPLALAGAVAVVLAVSVPVADLGAPTTLAFAPVAPSSSSSTTGVVAPGVTTVPATAAPPTVTVPPARPPRIVVVGDSTAGRNGPGLEAWGIATGRLQVVTVYEPGCAVLFGPRFVVRDGYEFRPSGCDELFPRAAAAAADLDADAIVVFMGSAQLADWEYPGLDGLHHLGEAAVDGRYQNALGAALGQLERAGRPVLWASVALPQWDLDEFGRELGSPVPGTGPVTLNDPLRTVRINQLDPPILARTQLAQRFDFAARLVGRDGSVPKRIRPDGLHLSKAGVAEISDGWLFEMLGDAYRQVTGRHPGGLRAVARHSWSAPGAPLAAGG